MEQKSFSELLKSLRLKNKWSQEEACEGVCDRRTYIRWEKGISEPSDYYLHLLSYRFNYDLQAYYKLFICNKSMSALSLKQEAYKYVDNCDWISLGTFLDKIQPLSEFQSGENLQNIFYYKSLYTYLYKENYNLAIDYCIKGLQVENNLVTLENPAEKIFSNVGICILNCLANILNTLGNREQCNNIYINVLYNIESKIIPDITHYQSTEFEKRLYQSISYNLSLNYMKNDELTLALKYINKGIEFSLKHNYLDRLANLLELKFKLLYQKEEYEESKQYFSQCMSLYLLQNKIESYKYGMEDLHSIYPKIL